LESTGTNDGGLELDEGTLFGPIVELEEKGSNMRKEDQEESNDGSRCDSGVPWLSRGDRRCTKTLQ
jgi:hypothetical protein